MRLDDELFSQLGRSLYSLEKHGPLLADLLFPAQGSVKDSFKAPARRGSKPPLVVPLVDLVSETEQLLGRWAGLLVRALPEVEPVPCDRSIASRASWLSRHLAVLEVMPWAQQCAVEVVAQSRLVADVVDPPAAESDPDPVEVGTCRVIASWASMLGYEVSYRTVSRWAREGVIESQLLVDGRVLVRLADVLHHLRERKLLGGVTPQGIC